MADEPHDGEDDRDATAADDDMTDADPGDASASDGTTGPDDAVNESPTEKAADDDDAAAGATSEEGAESGRPVQVRLSTMRSINARIIGTVVLHYAPRDVHVTLDGASAMRLLTAFRQRREGKFGDDLTPNSPAYSGWFVLDLEEPLAMSWMPADPRAMRTAIDPAVESAIP